MCLDAWVAETVMGWHEWTGDDDYSGPYPMWRDWGTGVAVYDNELLGSISFMFSPSTRIKDAWLVVETITKDRWLNIACYQGKYGVYNFSNDEGPEDSPGWENGAPDIQEIATSAPLAICRAAILVSDWANG